MEPDREETERRRAWVELRAAVHTYSENPSERNSARVSEAVLRLNTTRQRALAQKIIHAARLSPRKNKLG